MTIKIIILISIYIISVLAVRNWFGRAHSTNGRWNNLQTGTGCIFFTVTPLLNTIVMVIHLFESPYHESYKPPRSFNKFFGVKK